MLWKGRATLALTDHSSPMRHAQDSIQLGLAGMSQHAPACLGRANGWGYALWVVGVADIPEHILLLWAQLVPPTEPEVSGRDRVWGSLKISEPWKTCRELLLLRLYLEVNKTLAWLWDPGETDSVDSCTLGTCWGWPVLSYFK